MATLRVEKVNNALPSTLQPNTLYFVKTGNTVVTYISDGTGSQAHKVSGEDQPHSFLLMGATNA